MINDVRTSGKNWIPNFVHYTISGFSSERTNLSPFTKDFRGEEHSKSVSLFLSARASLGCTAGIPSVRKAAVFTHVAYPLAQGIVFLIVMSDAFY